MTIQMKIKSAPFTLALAGSSAILLGLTTIPRNVMGWALLLWGVGLLAIPLGRFHFLWHLEEILHRMKSRRIRLLTAGIFAVSIIPPVDFLFLPAFLSRSQWMQDAGLILCALGLLFLLRSVIAWECWTGQDIAEPEILRRLEIGTNSINAFLFSTGITVWAFGMCAGFGSVLGSLVLPLLVLPGLSLQKN
jgi:hypothetical protein